MVELFHGGWKKTCQPNAVDQHICVVYCGLRVWVFLRVLLKLISVCGLLVFIGVVIV